MDAGLELAPRLGTEFDVDDLIWMDTATRTTAAKESISAGALSPNEARSKYYGLDTVVGGDTPYMQQQMFSLSALAERDAESPFSKPAPAPMATPAASLDPADVAAEKFARALHKKTAALYAA